MVGVGLWDEDRLPPGPRRDLVLSIRVHYELAGKPSTRDISRQMERGKAEHGGWLSHDGVHAALCGRGVPRWPNLAALVRALVTMQSLGEQTDPDAVVRRIHAAWLKVDDTRRTPVSSEDRSTPDRFIPSHAVELSERESGQQRPENPDLSGTLDRTKAGAQPVNPAPQASAEVRNLVDDIGAHSKTARQPVEKRAWKDIPSWPKVTIRLYDDHNAEVKIAGRSHPINHHDPRQAAIQLISERAAQLGRPVIATAVEPDGTSWPLIIHPDGRVEAAQQRAKSKESTLRRWLPPW